jgi:hypothetical protein
MPPAANPLRLQVIDRIYAVLGAITTGASYFYAPAQVTKKFVHWAEAIDFPVYMVFSDSQGSIELTGAAGSETEYSETFNLNIKGIISDPSDTVSVLEKCLRDIRKAINDDSISSSAGSLMQIPGVIQVEIVDGAETDNGYLSAEGKGFFEQRIKVTICGKYGEL